MMMPLPNGFHLCPPPFARSDHRRCPLSSAWAPRAPDGGAARQGRDGARDACQPLRLGKTRTHISPYVHPCLSTNSKSRPGKKKRDDGAWMPRCSARRLRRRSLEAALARRSASHNQRASDRRTDGLTNWPTAPAACSPMHIGPHRCWARKAQAADRQKRKEGPRECAPIDPGTWADKNKRHTHLLAPGGRALNAVRWCCSRDHWGSAVRGKRGVSYHRDS